jgi:hypothetical protein
LELLHNDKVKLFLGEKWWIMKVSTAGVLVSAAATTIAMTLMMTTMTTTNVVLAYTFDPLNNIWKPSGPKNTAVHRPSSFASSYAPHPLEVAEAAPVLQGDDVIRAQYATWAGYYHNGVNQEHGESFQQQSLVQIEYNKRTGEVSLVDHDGIVTKEDYQNLMRAIARGGTTTNHHADHPTSVVDSTTSQVAHDVDNEDAVVLETIHIVDGEDIDPNDVIDTCVEEVQPAFRDQPSEVATETFQTYSIPKPPMEIQTHLQEQQYHQLQYIQQQHYQQQHHHHHGRSMKAYHPPLHLQGPSMQASDVTEPLPQPTPQNGGWGFNDRRTTFIK